MYKTCNTTLFGMGKFLINDKNESSYPSNRSSPTVLVTDKLTFLSSMSSFAPHLIKKLESRRENAAD